LKHPPSLTLRVLIIASTPYDIMQTASELKLGSDVDDGRDRIEVVLPSWLLSIVTHIVLFVAMAMILRGCSSSGSVGPKAGDAQFREIGLHVARDAVTPPNDNAEAQPQEAMTCDAGLPQPEKSVLGDDAAINELLTLPNSSNLPIIGGGPATSLRTPSDAKELIKSTGRPKAGGDEASGLGETTFFDIAAKGNRFIYVVDRSGSMYDHGAIRVAKEELVTSLSALEQTQQFQVLFYNQKLLEMHGNDDRPQMQWATDINRTFARQFISNVQPDGGTDHMPALKKALRFQTDHLFFLTDADQPVLSARELNEIKTLNNGRTKIHCVEFGKGPELSSDNFLKKLARDNGGTYRYRDVTRFGQK
jgi:Ca-activated chloride channel family protein